ncbi:VOC family protein [Myxococcus sp. AM009]|uniref:VOC family protein n=1 Tax=unclassified Myxococcus TaxID=2648731 RepID=UPI001595CD36|nr:MULTISPECIES: VOC family protein [unclassified Myxococcus]NVI98701.1 VOC family protein [Myxococcus sp. AM009]NVJ13306.1 VOC family protein [Myxococcus sp. AM010]
MPEVKTPEMGTPVWMDLMTPDLEKARAFYGPLLGWSFVVGTQDTHFYTMCQVNGLNAAGMGQKPPDLAAPSAWTLYFGVEDIDATAALVQKHGGQVGMGPMDVFDQGRLAICTDPTGAHFGLWQPLEHRGAQLEHEPGAMTWREVNTRDAAKAIAFYSALFGFEAKKLEGMGDMQYWTLHKGKTAVGGVLQMGESWPAEVPAHWLSYFAVADADVAVRQVTELGGKVLQPPEDSPYGRLAVVADPAGATFVVIKLSETSPEM